MTDGVTKITHQDITNFIKLLVEMGGVFVIDPDEFYIRNKNTEKLIKLEDKDKETAIKIYHNNRIPGDYFILNLFKEAKRPSVVQTWMFERFEEIMSMTLILIMNGIINVILDEENNDKLMELMQYLNVSEKAKPDAKMKDEIKKLQVKDMIDIDYNDEMKRGEIRSFLNDKEVKKKYVGFRAKTWDFIYDIFDSLFKCSPMEISKLFNHIPTSIGAPRCETILVLVYRFFRSIEDISKILNIKICDLDDYEDHLRYVEKYQKMVLWESGERSRPLKEISVPWNESPVGASHAANREIPSYGRADRGIPRTGSRVPNIVATPYGMRTIGEVNTDARYPGRYEEDSFLPPRSDYTSRVPDYSRGTRRR